VHNGGDPCKHWWKYVRYRRCEGNVPASSPTPKFAHTSCRASTGWSWNPRKARRQLRKMIDRVYPSKQCTARACVGSADNHCSADKHSSTRSSSGGAGKPRKATSTTGPWNLDVS